MLKLNGIVFVLTLTLCYVTIQAKCPAGCKDATLSELYNDINCKPIYDKETDCCPTSYDCSNIEKAEKDTCTYKGKSYKNGEELPKDDTYANCHVGCRCIDGKINCAILDCPEWLGVPVQPGCYRTYETGKCCSTGMKCPKVDKIEKCTVGDKTYNEGERFSAPDKKCHECTCQKGFKGEYVEPFCKNNGCSAEIRNTENIKKNCAPVYSSSDCCPFEWICPDEKLDKFISTTKSKDNSAVQCKYGPKVLNLKEQFERTTVISDFEKTETKCECLVPPFVTCNLKRVYDLEKAPAHIRPHLKSD